MSAEPFDVDSLPPTQYLVLEVLAARARLGESSWPLPNSARPALKALAAHGLVGYKSDVMPDSQRAWLTSAGEAACFDAEYVPPVLRDTGLPDPAYKALEEAFVQQAMALNAVVRFGPVSYNVDATAEIAARKQLATVLREACVVTASRTEKQAPASLVEQSAPTAAPGQLRNPAREGT